VYGADTCAQRSAALLNGNALASISNAAVAAAAAGEPFTPDPPFRSH